MRDMLTFLLSMNLLQSLVYMVLTSAVLNELNQDLAFHAKSDSYASVKKTRDKAVPLAVFLIVQTILAIGTTVMIFIQNS